MVLENNLVIHSNVKVENDDQSKLVFGQSVGGETRNRKKKEEIYDILSNEKG